MSCMMFFVKALIYSLVAILALIAYVRFIEATSIFFPSREILSTPKDIGLDYENIFFTTQDHVSLNGWLIKAPSNSADQPTLIFCHGNAGNISDRIDKIAAFRQMGLNVFIFDYRGYGKSQGKPDEPGIYKDAAAAFDYLMTRKDIAHDKIIAYGASLGGAVAVDLAAHRQVSCLILDSTFSSAADMAKEMVAFIPSFLLNIKLDSVTKVQDISVPKLFIHSRDDEIVPFALGRKLYESAPSPKEFLEIDGSHNEGFLSSQEDFFGGIRDFLKKKNLI